MPDLPPAECAEALAYFKAVAVHRLQPEQIVLGADTIVALRGRIYGKAVTPDAARDMLAALSGQRQEVITGLALLLPGEASGLPSDHPRRFLASDVTHVTMRPMGPEEIEEYIASGEWIDKAGAYAIQETADRFVERVEGSLTNVVGLPVELLERLLDKALSTLTAG